MRLEPAICFCHDGFGINGRVLQNHACVHLVLEADDNAIANLRKTVQHRLHVLRIYVHTLRRHDDVFLSTPVIEPALRVELADVAGVEPALLIEFPHDALTTHEDFSIGRYTHVLSLERLTQRAASRMERMIHGDDGTGLRQTVSLNDEVAELAPKRFELGFDVRAADNEAPEPPSESRMHTAIPPPPFRDSRPALAAGRRR